MARGPRLDERNGVRIVLANAVTLNGGDAAIAIAALQVFEQAFPGATVQIVDSQSDVARRLYTHLSFVPGLAALLPRGKRAALSMARLLAAARLYRQLGPAVARRLCRRVCSDAELSTLDAYAQADLIVSTGGTYLVEHYGLRTRRFELEVCVQLGKPLVFLTQSLGPFAKPINRLYFRRLFNLTPLALLRDKRSEQNLRDIGVTSPRLCVVPDVVFALADPEVLRAAAERSAFREATPRIAVSVRAWGHFSGGESERGMVAYKAAIAAVVEHLVSKYQADVTFLSTCQGVPEYAHDDSRTAHEIHATLSPAARARSRVDAGFHTPEQLMSKLRTFDAVVATRMHMAILSLISGTPVVPIAYEFKTRELFNELGQGDLVVAIEDTTAERLIAATERLFERIRTPEARRALFASVERARQGALSAADRLAEVLRDRRRPYS
jgi:colanic acid/amylovoran biosynthesis protein WcaK/AmsJ